VTKMRKEKGRQERIGCDTNKGKKWGVWG